MVSKNKAPRVTTGDDLIDITADIRTHMEIIVDLARELAKSRPHGVVARRAKEVADYQNDLLNDCVAGGLEALIEREPVAA